LILRIVGQRSRLHCPSTCSQLDFRTFVAFLILNILFNLKKNLEQAILEKKYAVLQKDETKLHAYMIE